MSRSVGVTMPKQPHGRKGSVDTGSVGTTVAKIATGEIEERLKKLSRTVRSVQSEAKVCV